MSLTRSITDILEASNDVEEEIEKRKAKMQAIKKEWVMTQTNGSTDIPIDILDQKMPLEHPQQGLKATPRQQDLLDAIAQCGYKPGDTVNTCEIAVILGIGSSYFYELVRDLKHKSLWIYKCRAARRMKP